jgi:hypothetical protein
MQFWDEARQAPITGWQSEALPNTQHKAPGFEPGAFLVRALQEAAEVSFLDLKLPLPGRQVQ